MISIFDCFMPNLEVHSSITKASSIDPSLSFPQVYFRQFGRGMFKSVDRDMVWCSTSFPCSFSLWNNFSKLFFKNCTGDEVGMILKLATWHPLQIASLHYLVTLSVWWRDKILFYKTMNKFLATVELKNDVIMKLHFIPQLQP